MKKIYISATPTKGTRAEAVADDALEALSRHEKIERADATVGLFGKLMRRDFKKERGE